MHEPHLIQPLDPATADATTLAAIGRLLDSFRLLIDPTLRPLTIDEVRKRYGIAIDFIRTDYWWLPDDNGEALGWAYAERWIGTKHNQHNLFADILVAPHARRQGIASAFLRYIADVAAAEGRSAIAGDVTDRVPAGEAFIRQIGGKLGMRHLTSELKTAEVDRDLLTRWVAAAPTDRFELLAIDGVVPDELLEQYAELRQLMNTAPLEALTEEPVDWTPAQVRQLDEDRVERGHEVWLLIARERATGQFAGFTELLWNPFQPTRMEQDDTAVAPAWRGNGLGRWIKAVNMLRVLDERPEVERVRTGNAQSNEPMLKINRAMGFKPFWVFDIYELTLDDIQTYLARRATPAVRTG